MKTLVQSAVAAALLAGSAVAVSAASVTQTFEAEIVSQTPAGTPNYVGVTGMGSVTFDDADFGSVLVDPSNFSLTLDFTSGSETFNGDPSDPFLQALIDADGSGGLNGLDFTQFDDDTFTMAIEDLINAPGIIAFSISNVIFGSPGVITKVELDAEVELVPLPGALPLMLGALGLAGFVARRKSA